MKKKRLVVILGCKPGGANFSRRIKTAVSMNYEAYVISGTESEKAFGNAILEKMLFSKAEVITCKASSDTLGNLLAIGSLTTKYDNTAIVTDKIHMERVKKLLDRFGWSRQGWDVMSSKGPSKKWDDKTYRIKEWYKRLRT